MSNRLSIATVGSDEKDHAATISTAQNVYDNGMYSTSGALLYLNPPNAKVDYKTQLDKTIAAEAKVTAGGSTHDTKDRDLQSGNLRGMSVANVNYANQLYRGNTVNLDKSGYPVSKEPTPHGVTDPPKVDRAENGKTSGTVKFYLTRTKSPLKKTKEILTYYIYATSDPDSMDNLKCILHTRNSSKLIISNVVRGRDMYYYLTSENAAGESDFSERVKYMLN